MGAPEGNRNSLRHGLLSANAAPFPGVKKIANALRRTIEDAVLARLGEIDLHHAALVSSAVRWEVHSLLCQRWLRAEHEKLSAADRLAYSREIPRASSERDKALAGLGLGKREQSDLLADFYRQPLAKAAKIAPNGTTATTEGET